MPDETVETRKISVTFERKLGTANYGNVTARAWVESTMSMDASPVVVSETLSEAFAQAKAAVFDELGIEVTMDESGVLREKYEPVASVESRLGAELGATPAPAGSFGYDKKGLDVANEKDMVQDIPNDIVAKCQQAGITKVWANNGKFGQFYKEFVPQGEDAKLGLDDQGRTKIIK